MKTVGRSCHAQQLTSPPTGTGLIVFQSNHPGRADYPTDRTPGSSRWTIYVAPPSLASLSNFRLPVISDQQSGTARSHAPEKLAPCRNNFSRDKNSRTGERGVCSCRAAILKHRSCAHWHTFLSSPIEPPTQIRITAPKGPKHSRGCEES